MPIAAIPIGLAVLSTLSQAQGQEQQNQAIQDRAARLTGESNFEAAQLQQNAGQTIAASQRIAENEDRKTQLVTSRALALGAASGGGVSDPTVMNIISKINGEGAYRRSVALYQGEAEARQLNLNAQGKILQGQYATADAASANSASKLAVASTLLRGGASLYSKYAAGGPSSDPNQLYQ